MAEILTRAALAELGEPGLPSLSLYQPTHRRHPDNLQDPLRFERLLESLQDSLRRQFAEEAVRKFLSPFRALSGDRDFWNHTLDGLAVLGAPGIFRVFLLPRPVPEIAIVAASFHLKPLRRMLQTADRFQVLALTQREVGLWEGDREFLEEAVLAPQVPRSLTDALGEELTEPHLHVSYYGGRGHGRIPMRHGHGGRSEAQEIDLERFFRIVDRAVLEHHSRPTGLPLMLAALPEHQGIFRSISRNPFLLVEGMQANPHGLDPETLRRRCWAVMEPQYQARLEVLSAEFRSRPPNLRTSDLQAAAQAAASGRVSTLLLESERQVPGRLTAEGRVLGGDLADPLVDDVLDDLGAKVEEMGGRVVVAPARFMPSDTGLAAILRY